MQKLTPAVINLSALPKPIQAKVKLMSRVGRHVYVKRLGRFGAYDVHMPPNGSDKTMDDWTMVIGYKNGR